MTAFTMFGKCKEGKHGECQGAEVPFITDPEFYGGRVCSCACHRPDLPESTRRKAAAIMQIKDGEWPEQYAAMMELRRLGVDIVGEGYGGDFRWVVGNEVIPRPQPEP